MVRRFFISAFSSVIALTASALDPAVAAETQNATMQPRMPSFRSPTQLFSTPRRSIELAGYSTP
jgi:hypothetical protein